MRVSRVGFARGTDPERRAAQVAEPSPAGRRPDAGMILALQRSAGNRAVVQLLDTLRTAAGPRAVGERNDGERNDGPGMLAAVQRTLRSPGHGLPDAVRTDMEDRLRVPDGALRSVVVHDRPADHDLSRSLGAVAFTSGEHVVGDVSTPRTMAHELMHVVQQRRGAVSGGTVVPGLRVSDPQDRFEREAAMFSAGRSVAPGPGADGRTAEAAGSGGTAIQREIGFEYEIGGISTYSKDGQGEKRRLRKNQLIVAEKGYKVVADDPPTGSSPDDLSDLEFIIEHVHEDDAGRGTMIRTAEAVVAELKRIVDPPVELPAKRWLGSKADRAVFLDFDEYWRDSGVLQATVGLDMRALVALRRGDVSDRWSDEAAGLAPAEEGESSTAPWTEQGGSQEGERDSKAKAFQAKDAEASLAKQAGANPGLYKKCWKKTRHQQDSGNREIEAAILSLIVEIPLSAYTQRAVPYPKALAGPLLARTDFASLVRLASPKVIEDITGTDVIERVVFQILDDENSESRKIHPETEVRKVDRSSPVFPQDFKESVRPQITLGQWFDGFRETTVSICGVSWSDPVDRLTKQNYPRDWRFGKNRKRDDAEAAALESLGARGRSTDAPFTAGRSRRAIFEMRSLGSTPLDDLVTHCKTVWKLVQELHGA